MDRPTKRQRVSCLDQGENGLTTDVDTASLVSLRRPVTPPLTRQLRRDSPSKAEDEPPQLREDQDSVCPAKQPSVIRSPIQLTHIRDLPSSSGSNVDAVQLKDILGNPLIRECWQFNYCFDVDFIMDNFDEDVKDLVQVKIVHGSWKKDSPNRIRVDEACARYPNVEAMAAYMPEPFGTHHSKMMVLLRHDDLAQVIIHTANMIPGDWGNMTQAVWQSPLLPLASPNTTFPAAEHSVFGSGKRFKRDLLSYLEFYGGKRTGRLVAQLKKHDFTAIKAALVASVPSREKLGGVDSERSTLWGWPALKDTVCQIPLKRPTQKRDPHVVIQVSSIATLGQTEKWLKETLFDSLSSSPSSHSIVYPTPDEIRRSLNGYASGGSIHMKLQSAAQQKQLQYLKPYLCHWAGDQDDDITLGVGKSTRPEKREAGRRRAAPHIKTYIQFSDKTTMDRIDWAMITSANLSTQAWGASPNKDGEVRICSWEIGVIVWPQLISNNKEAEMVPCFKTDIPHVETSGFPVVGLRMPYDLPLTKYRSHDVPWSATTVHLEPDWLGQTWQG